MATVYLGRATGTAGFEKLVAVKAIHPHLAEESEFVEMFLDEARIAARLHHPHVVEILDLGTSAEGVFYMVMEYVEGATLSALLRQLRKREETLPIPVVLQIVADACEGLEAAHELCDRDGNPYGLVHRDVSPQNLLVNLDGWVKVVDFGIMKAAGKRSTTLEGQLRGKLPYMAPEQARRQPVDHRGDLFAIGVVLWELLTNQRLFAGGSEVEVLDRVTRCEVPDIFVSRPDLPAGMDKLLRRTLARDPDDRYESARAMLLDVRQLLRGIGDDTDPRRALADAMREHFSAQVEYARAAVRSSPEGSGELDVFLPAPDFSRSASGRPAEGGSSGVQPGSISQPLPLQGTGTHTLASTLATAPARHWSLWLLLPLVGAAIGTAAITWDGRNGTGAISEPTPTSASLVEPSVPTKVEPAEVVWDLNTVPQGATVVVGGVEKGVTPIRFTMPRGEAQVPVRLEKEGYRTVYLDLAPVADLERRYPLDRIDAGIAAGDRLRARTKEDEAAKKREREAEASKKGKAGRKRKKPELKPSPDEWKNGDDKRKLKSEPDWSKQVESGTGSGGGG
jgi:serine/threonine protein kinase